MSHALLTRRQWLTGSAAAVAFAAAASTSRTALAAGDKVLMIGGSTIATAFGQYLADALEKKHGDKIERHAKSSSGLSRPDFYDWQAHARQLYARIHPKASIVMMGGNDCQALWAGERNWIKYGTSEWEEAYLARVEELIRHLSPQGETVVWIGLPPMRSPSFQRKVNMINGLYQRAADAHGNVHYIATEPYLSKNGQFAALMNVDGKNKEVRGEDGVHLTMEGAHLLERSISAKIHELVS